MASCMDTKYNIQIKLEINFKSIAFNGPTQGKKTKIIVMKFVFISSRF